MYQCNSTYNFHSQSRHQRNAFQMTINGGGFSAGSGALSVNIGNGAALTWGVNVGTQLVGPLSLSSNSATSITTFTNAIDLNGGARVVNVDNNTASTADYAVMSGTSPTASAAHRSRRTAPARSIFRALPATPTPA